MNSLMKQKMKNALLMLIILCVGISSCVEDDALKTYTLQVELNFPEEAVNIPKNGHTVYVRNEAKGISLETITDENGLAVFSDIEPGSYTVSTFVNLLFRNQDRVLNGYEEIDINANFNGNLNLTMAQKGKFVISQFYYSGHLTVAGKLNYSDQFIEIYNNSADTLYADRLSIIEHEARGEKPSEWKEWEPTHMVVKAIWTIPGNGKDVPVAPGKGLVIATNGANHKSDPDGSPKSPVDLGDADFEYYLSGGISKDIDYPNVKNLIEDLFVLKGSTTYFDVRGGSAMALAWLPQDRQTYIEENMVPMQSLNNTRYYCTIPNDFIEDAIEPVWADREPYKRLDPSLDAGHVAVQAGSKSGLCIRRIIEKVVDERTILMDTNNSTADFMHDVVPLPRFYAIDE